MKKSILFLAAFVFSIGIANAKGTNQGAETLDMEELKLTCFDVAVDYANRMVFETGDSNQWLASYSYAKILCDAYN